MVLPTAYLGPKSWFDSLPATIEVMETFEKQTFRNRCLIRDPQGQVIRLTVPVKKSETKQLTRDVEISYQTRWQHQHWMAIKSSYGQTPYYDYFEEFLRPWYERETRFLVDLNEGLAQTVLSLLHRQRPSGDIQTAEHASIFFTRTHEWAGTTWTDAHPWQQEMSVLERLFDE